MVDWMIGIAWERTEQIDASLTILVRVMGS